MIYAVGIVTLLVLHEGAIETEMELSALRMMLYQLALLALSTWPCSSAHKIYNPLEAIRYDRASVRLGKVEGERSRRAIDKNGPRNGLDLFVLLGPYDVSGIVDSIPESVVSVRASPQSLARSGDSVTVTWSGVQNPSAEDWIGVYTPPQ